MMTFCARFGAREYNPGLSVQDFGVILILLDARKLLLKGF